MHRQSRLLAAATLLFSHSVFAEDPDGWVNLFNGKDLSNWVNVNCAPETWTVADGVITVNKKPSARHDM